jgi:hypothetical protein
MFALTCTFASANQNEQKHSLNLLEKTKLINLWTRRSEEAYHKRSRIEAVYSFLKTQYSLAVNMVRGLGNVVSYALLSILCLVLNREAAENMGRDDKAVSPAYFNT